MFSFIPMCSITAYYMVPVSPQLVVDVPIFATKDFGIEMPQEAGEEY